MSSRTLDFLRIYRLIPHHSQMHLYFQNFYDRKTQRSESPHSHQSHHFDATAWAEVAKRNCTFCRSYLLHFRHCRTRQLSHCSYLDYRYSEGDAEALSPLVSGTSSRSLKFCPQFSLSCTGGEEARNLKIQAQFQGEPYQDTHLYQNCIDFNQQMS